MDELLSKTINHAPDLFKLNPNDFLSNIDPILGNEPKFIHILAFNGNFDMITQLIKFNNDESTKIFLDQTDSNGLTILHFAAAGGHLSIIKYLHDLFPKYLNLVTKEKKTFIHYACEYNHLNILKYAKAIKKSLKDLKPPTPIEIAIDNMNLAIVEYIVSVEKFDDATLTNLETKAKKINFLEAYQLLNHYHCKEKQ